MRRRKRNSRNTGPDAALANRLGISLPEVSNESLSPNEIGEVLGVSGEAIKQWIYTKRLPAVKLSNGYWKVRKDDLERFLRSRYEIRKRLIVISDDSRTLQLVTNTAARLNIDVTVCSNLADAILKVNELHPSLVIADIDMPFGWDFVCKLRSMRKIVKMPVLAIMSEELSEQRLDEALELSIRGCLLKPVTVENLEREILIVAEGQT